jgi:hypothetical protein
MPGRSSIRFLTSVQASAQRGRDQTAQEVAMPKPVFIDEARPAGSVRSHLSAKRRLKTDWSLTAESFAKFLRWLSPDDDEAGRKYEQIRKKMVRFFTWRGCHIPEELFDKTVDRACRKIELGGPECSGDALAFCYAVGRFVLQEYWREAKPTPLPDAMQFPQMNDPGGIDQDERRRECLEKCLNRLSERSRDLITRYYQGEGRERIRKRKELASAMGGMNALRIQVFRIRSKLRDWVSAADNDKDQ